MSPGGRARRLGKELPWQLSDPEDLASLDELMGTGAELGGDRKGMANVPGDLEAWAFHMSSCH